MSRYKLATREIPEDASFSKLRSKPKAIEQSDKETYPWTKLGLTEDNTFFVKGVKARALRGAIQSATNRLKRKFIARTETTKFGEVKGTRVYRVQ